MEDLEALPIGFLEAARRLKHWKKSFESTGI